MKEKPCFIAVFEPFFFHQFQNSTSNRNAFLSNFFNFNQGLLWVQLLLNHSKRQYICTIYSFQYFAHFGDRIILMPEKVAKQSLLWQTFEHEGLQRSIEHFVVIMMGAHKMFFPRLQFSQARLLIFLIILADPRVDNVDFEERVI